MEPLVPNALSVRRPADGAEIGQLVTGNQDPRVFALRAHDPDLAVPYASRVERVLAGSDLLTRYEGDAGTVWRYRLCEGIFPKARCRAAQHRNGPRRYRRR